MREGYKKVSREEFRQFLNAYPGGLVHECASAGDPPIHGYYDFKTGSAMDVAQQAYCIYADGRGGEDEFYVRTNCEPRE